MEFHGTFRDGNLYYTGESLGSKGPVQHKMTFFNLGDGRVRQLWEQSTDAGKAWSVAFDGLYTRKEGTPVTDR